MLLSEKVAHLLEKAILKGEFPPGCRFPPERELAERYHVSRATVREAMGRLAQLGLVETLPQSGTYVTEYLIDGSLDLLVHLMKTSETVDSDVVLSLMEFRKMSEVFAVRKAVLNAKESDIEKLSEIVKRESAPSLSPQEMAECDFALHETIVELARNLVLQLVFNSSKPIYQFYADLFFNLPDAIDVTVAQHKRLVDTFSRKDVESAASIIDEVLGYGEERVVQALGNSLKRKGEVLLKGGRL